MTDLDTQWRLPEWVSSQTYIVGVRSAMAIISNQRTRRVFALRDESAVLWSRLESGRFNRLEAIGYLREIGSDTPQDDLVALIERLVAGGCLLSTGIQSEQVPAQTRGDKTRLPIGAGGEPAQVIEDEISSFARKHGFLFSAALRLSKAIGPDETLRRIQCLRRAGAYRLTLAGEGMFLRPDIFDVIAQARSLRLELHLLTNDISLDQAGLERLNALYPASVTMTGFQSGDTSLTLGK